MLRTALLLTASLVLVAAGPPAEKPKHVPNAFEKLLHGAWEGGPCIGDLTFRPDGTFKREHFSPGNNKVAGTWEVKWNSPAPALVMTCKMSDAQDRIPIGQVIEFKLIELDEENFAYEWTNPEQRKAYTTHYTRVSSTLSEQEKALGKELGALQGTWVPLQYESEGKHVSGEFNFKQIVHGDSVTFLVDGATKAEGKVILDPTKNPKQLDFQFTSSQTDLIIYVRAGNHLIYCGNRDGKTRPSEFATGTANGGEYLQVWKIEK